MSADDVLQFMRLLDSAPKSRRTWRVLQCHCRGCGDLAIEVFRTPVVTAPLVAVYNGLRQPDSAAPSILGMGDKGLRATTPTVSVLLTDIQDGLQVACKCGKRVVAAGTMLGAIRNGQRKVVLDAPA